MFGKNTKKDFLISEDHINISVGTSFIVHKEVYKKTNEIREDIFINSAQYKKNLSKLIRQSASVLGEYIKTDANNVAFTSSGTESMNTILRSLVLLAGDEIVVDANIYPTTMRILEFVCARAGARINKVYIPSNASISEIVDKYETAIHVRTRLLVIEDTKVIDGLRNPLDKILPLFKEKEILTLVDGAGSFGMYDINFDAMGVDWYIGSCHKWLLSYLGTGFIVSKPEHHKLLRSMRISQRHNDGYPHSFDWVGSNDYAPWLTLDTAINSINQFGEENIRQYCNDLVIQGANVVAEKFGVKYNVPENISTFMTSVELPSELQDKKISVDAIKNHLLENNVSAHINLIDNVKYVRLSAYIYNELSDYEKFAEEVLKLTKGNLL
ncbi:MAG: aminotransferase class V-fold PLP-dependent enzyme [Alphaproteobacteria bacterium]